MLLDLVLIGAAIALDHVPFNREEAASLLRHVGTRNDYMESAFLARTEFGQRAFVPRTAVLERMCGSWS